LARFISVETQNKKRQKRQKRQNPNQIKKRKKKRKSLAELLTKEAGSPWETEPNPITEIAIIRMK